MKSAFLQVLVTRGNPEQRQIHMDELDLNFLEFDTEFPLRISDDGRVVLKPDI